jgi:hypothetical protein
LNRFPVICAFALLGFSLPVRAQQPTPTPDSPGKGYLADWFQRVATTQSEQPHWITPVATTTPRLEEEFRFDTDWQTNAQGITSENYGGGRGLELIPYEKLEVILSIPPYIAHHNPSVQDGFGDFQFLLKYRLLSKNEESGSYILTAFLSVSLPTGQYKNGATDPILTPTIAYGKGFGNFDFQGTLGITLPTGNGLAIGRTIPWNNAFQYRVRRKFWPEVEVNSTHFQDGPNNGKTQVFLTPGLVIGKLPLWKRLGLTVGGGFQIAATHFHPTNHNAIFNVRFPF